METQDITQEAPQTAVPANTCPYCHEDLEEPSHKCPYCGSWLAPAPAGEVEPQAPAMETIPTTSAGGRNESLYALLAAVVAGLFSIALGISVNNHHPGWGLLVAGLLFGFLMIPILAMFWRL